MANYHLSKGRRFKKGTRLTDYGRMYIFRCLQVEGYWWCEDSNVWVKDPDDCTGRWYGAGNHSLHSVKASERHIRTHYEIPKGTKYWLISNFEEIPCVEFTK